MQTRLFTIFIIAIFSFTLRAQQFEFEHATCYVYVQAYKDKKLESLARELLKEKRYVIKEIQTNNKILPGELYIDIKKTKEKKRIFPACIIESRLKLSKTTKMLATDKTLYVKNVKRSVPRVTQNGTERCTRALRDTFVHIPYCRAIGYAGEKK